MLTDTEIRKAKPRDERYRLTDGRGLYLVITPTGSKLWRYKYRFAGVEKLMALGQYPDVSLVEAREQHAQARRVLAGGADPMETRKAERVALSAGDSGSFHTVALAWWDHWQAGKSPKHAKLTRSRLDQNIFPTLGARPIAEIEAPELVKMAKAVEARGASDLAKRSLETAGQVFRYAIAHGHCRRNPAADIKPADVLRARHRVNLARVDAKDLPGLLRAIEVYRGKPVTRLAMRLMALTFVRTSELINAPWSEIDFERARWDIPAERMKMNTPHIVPLSRQALEVLELLKEITGTGLYLFPGDQDPKKPMSNNAILKALARMGYKGTMTGHGFRGLASTLLHERGYEHQHIELQLAHAPRNAVSAAYNHALYLEPRAAMMQGWADFLERTQKAGKPVW